MVLFVVALALWGATISHDTLGFVPLNGAQAVGYDFWTALMWLLFIYAARRLYLAFRKKKKAVEQ
ncbi:MAG: hypothetical protein LAN70_06075 [Acidobacteriia bacterium]|nr:hypothetical protein [Terriglobia bacterium]